jgi:hypothetical protein
MLILVKAPFFVTLFGGAVLYFLRKNQFKYIFKILVPQLAIFAILYWLFLSGAHQHNLWLIFPAIFWDIINIIIQIHQKFTLMKVVGLIAFIGMFAVIFACILSTYKKCKNNNLLLLLSSISFSAFLGILFLTEVFEGNSYLFYTASYFPTMIVLWNWLKSKNVFSRRSIVLIIIILISFSTVSTTSLVGKNIVKWYSDTFHENRFISTIYNRITGKEIKRPNFSIDLIDAYTWLGKNTKKEGVVLFGKHYEWFGYGQQYQPDTKFLRSGLSKMQMFCENYQYKGVGMQGDFAIRFSNSIGFYKYFVKSSEYSNVLLSFFENDSFGKEQAVPLSMESDLISKMIYYLSFHKEWIWSNRSKQIQYEIKENLKKIQNVKQDWALSFIKSSNIRYIVLESYDQPTEFLEKVTDRIYFNKSITILKIKQIHS